MNIILWVLQGMLALFFGMAASNQLFNYPKLVEQYPVYGSLPRAFWIAYALLTIACIVGLLLTKIAPVATPVAALVLAVQAVIFAALYARAAGFQPSLVMWAAWTLGPAALAAIVAWARFAELA